MSITLNEVMGAVRGRAASLVAEVAGYLVLGAADQVAGAPRRLTASDVTLDEGGTLRLVGGAPAPEPEAAAELRALLARLLTVASSVTPALSRASQRRESGMTQLVRELEAALIPVNRAAARRALSRLHRDVVRARDAGRILPVVEETVALVEEPEPEAEIVEVSVPLAELMASPEPGPVEPTPSPVVVEVVAEPPTRPEPVITRRSDPGVVPVVPDLELPPPARAVEEPLELRGADATERGPELTPELDLVVEVTAPLPVPAVEVTAPLPPQAAPEAALAEPSPSPEPEPTFPTPAPEPVIDWSDDVEIDALAALAAVPSADPVAFEPPELEPIAPQSPIEPMPVVALSRLKPAPPRSKVAVAAPPRYAPRQSDVNELLASFDVSEPAEQGSLCADLKALAGVERTVAPPAVVTSTPPPVAIDEADESQPPLARRRIGLGALVSVVSLAILGASAGVASSSRVVSAASGAAAPEGPACSATLAVSGIASGERALVRSGSEATPSEPTDRQGADALFTGLRCGEPVELTVASNVRGNRRWLRIPVSAEAMSPSADAPNDVRVAVSVR